MEMIYIEQFLMRRGYEGYFHKVSFRLEHNIVKVSFCNIQTGNITDEYGVYCITDGQES